MSHCKDPLYLIQGYASLRLPYCIIMEFLNKIASLWGFHSDTNLGESSSASMTIPSKAGMHCICYQAEKKMKTKDNAFGASFNSVLETRIHQAIKINVP